jgi:hypothetical protein
MSVHSLIPGGDPSVPHSSAFTADAVHLGPPKPLVCSRVDQLGRRLDTAHPRYDVGDREGSSQQVVSVSW